MTDASPHAEDFAPGRPIVFRNGIVITVDTPRRDSRRRRADHGRHHHCGGQGPAGAGRHRRDRRERRHPDARHDRHAPPHVADRPSWLRRRLGAEPVLRLLLPAARAGLPPRGHLRGQPAQRARVGRHRGHDDARLVARPADAGLRRGGAAGLRRDPGPFRARLRQLPRRRLGLDEHPRVRSLRRASASRTRPTCSACRSPST